MVSEIQSTSVVPVEGDITPREKEPVFNADKFGTYLGLACLPFKGLVTLFSWGEVLPLKPDILNLIATQRKTMKSITTTFKVPKFFLTESSVVQTCANFRRTVSATPPPDQSTLVEKVKETSSQILKGSITLLKFPAVLDKTGMINISYFPSFLTSGLFGTVVDTLSLVDNGAGLLDSIGKLRSVFRKTAGPDEAAQKELAQKKTKAVIKVTSGSLKLLSATLSAPLTLFAPVIAPVVLLMISSLSFVLKLTGKFISGGLPGSESGRPAPAAVLPA